MNPDSEKTETFFEHAKNTKKLSVNIVHYKDMIYKYAITPKEKQKYIDLCRIIEMNTNLEELICDKHFTGFIVTNPQCLQLNPTTTKLSLSNILPGCGKTHSCTIPSTVKKLSIHNFDILSEIVLNDNIEEITVMHFGDKNEDCHVRFNFNMKLVDFSSFINLNSINIHMYLLAQHQHFDGGKPDNMSYQQFIDSIKLPYGCSLNMINKK